MSDSLPAALQTVADVRLPYSLMACHELSMNAWITVFCKVFAEQASILVACQQCSCVQVAGVRLPYTVRDCDELNMKAWVTKLDTISDVCLTAALLLCASCH